MKEFWSHQVSKRDVVVLCLNYILAMVFTFLLDVRLGQRFVVEEYLTSSQSCHIDI